MNVLLDNRFEGFKYLRIICGHHNTTLHNTEASLLRNNKHFYSLNVIAFPDTFLIEYDWCEAVLQIISQHLPICCSTVLYRSVRVCTLTVHLMIVISSTTGKVCSEHNTCRVSSLFLLLCDVFWSN